MAHDQDLKIKARAFYECNELSIAKVAGHFDALGYGNIKKTMESWAGNDKQEGGKWVKGKYTNMRDAVEALLPPAVLEDVTESMKETIIKSLMDEGVGALDVDVIEAKAEAVSKELIFQTLNKHNLLGMMTENLQRAENSAKVSTSIGVHATFHSMLTSTIQTVYGKKVEMVPVDPNNQIMSDKEMETLSNEELQALLEGEA